MPTGMCTHGYSVFPSCFPTWEHRSLNTHADCKGQEYLEPSLLSAECNCSLFLQPSRPLPHLPGQASCFHAPPSDYSLPRGGPPSYPGLCCLGESALGHLLDWAGRGVSNPLALLTLLVAFPSPTSASRSRKPRRDTSRRYCMTWPYLPSSFVTTPRSIPG